MKILYKIIRTFNLLFAIIPSIGLYRATVQPEYNWGLLIIEGTGRSTDYKWLLLFTLIGWASFILERWYKRKWYYILPSILFTSSLMTVLYGYLNERQMIFQGDAWNISLNMGLFLSIFLTILFLSYISWAFKDFKNFKPQTLELDSRTLIGLVIIALQSISILFLFNQGKGGVHSNLDRIAVLLSVIQGLTIAYINDDSKIKDRTGN